MEVVHSVEGLVPFHGGVFVPTMGALHEGHVSLIRRAGELAGTEGGVVVVSVFVNPTQFGAGEDFGRYPRQLDEDVSSASSAGAGVVFAPSAGVVYPEGEVVAVPALPGVATRPGLEDVCRPGHFEGVCQVVARLFDLVRPRHAVFGEKDYQQLQVLRAMVGESGGRWGALTVHGGATVRESDGLAMSSRNVYLTEAQRGRALGLRRALQVAMSAQSPGTAETLMHETLEAHEVEAEYAVVRDAETLMPVGDFGRPTRGLIAGRVDSVRLIDNMALPVWK